MALLKRFIKDCYFHAWDNLAPLRGAISNHGYSIYSFNSCLEFENCRANLLDFLSSNNVLNDIYRNKPNGYALHFTDVLALYPGLRFALDQVVVEDVLSYLGPLSKLDGVYLGYFNSSSNLPGTLNTSSEYHHDSVGHRLKLFVPLNSFGNTPFPTSYLVKTNHRKWASYENAPNSSGQRIPEEFLNHSFEAEISVPYGSMYIFDTHGLHRGTYAKAVENRVILQFEFSNHYINPFGQAGPMSFSLNEQSYTYLDSFRILSRRHFRQADSTFYQQGLSQRDSDVSCVKLSDYM